MVRFCWWFLSALPANFELSPDSLGASQVELVVKNPPANAGDIRDVGSMSGWEDFLEKGIGTHFGMLAWKIPWTEEPTVHD